MDRAPSSQSLSRLHFVTIVQLITNPLLTSLMTIGGGSGPIFSKLITTPLCNQRTVDNKPLLTSLMTNGGGSGPIFSKLITTPLCNQRTVDNKPLLTSLMTIGGGSGPIFSKLITTPLCNWCTVNYKPLLTSLMTIVGWVRAHLLKAYHDSTLHLLYQAVNGSI